MELQERMGIYEAVGSGISNMSTTMQGVKALGKALRVKIRVEDAMPAEMQAMLLRLAFVQEKLQEPVRLPVPHRTSA